MTERPLRSWLYVPGDDARKIERAATCGADVVILDLEDGTPADRKAVARDRVASALAGTDFGSTRRFVRINAVDSAGWRRDVEATLAGDPDGYVIPKASAPESVTAVAEVLRALMPDGRPAPPLAAIVTEDVPGVLAAERTMTADDLVDFVFWGSEDLSASLGAWTSKDAGGELLDVFRVVRSLTLLQAVGSGRRAIDTPYLALGDVDGLAREARAVAEMGFTGKQAIHPEQVPVINEAFLPCAAELREARELVEAFEASAGAIVRVRDRMADAPHLTRARRVLALGALREVEA